MPEYNLYKVSVTQSDGTEDFRIVPANTAKEALKDFNKYMNTTFRGYPDGYTDISVELMATHTFIVSKIEKIDHLKE